LGEARPFGGKTVQVRGLDALLAVTAQLPVTEVVSEDKDNVRLAVQRGELLLKDVELRIRAAGQCGVKQQN